MTKSKMRIYKGRGYSDHEVDLYMTIEVEDVAELHIRTAHEDISVPACDMLTALWPLIEAAVDAGIEVALNED